ncbi:MAG: hypothetical protein QOJ29_4308 [Thermoleophilaceae bacterium]|jgi:hypothetical protein|nr:hypothetical protein [Thermoleophilaceae bacterium]
MRAVGASFLAAIAIVVPSAPASPPAHQAKLTPGVYTGFLSRGSAIRIDVRGNAVTNMDGGLNGHCEHGILGFPGQVGWGKRIPINSGRFALKINARKAFFTFKGQVDGHDRISGSVSQLWHKKPYVGIDCKEAPEKFTVTRGDMVHPGDFTGTASDGRPVTVRFSSNGIGLDSIKVRGSRNWTCTLPDGSHMTFTGSPPYDFTPHALGASWPLFRLKTGQPGVRAAYLQLNVIDATHVSGTVEAISVKTRRGTCVYDTLSFDVTPSSG